MSKPWLSFFRKKQEIFPLAKLDVKKPEKAAAPEPEIDLVETYREQLTKTNSEYRLFAKLSGDEITKLRGQVRTLEIHLKEMEAVYEENVQLRLNYQQKQIEHLAEIRAKDEIIGSKNAAAFQFEVNIKKIIAERDELKEKLNETN